MEGQQLIVLADANQSLHDRTDAYNLCDTIAKCSMVSAMEAKHAGASLRLVDRGTETIDHVLLQGIVDTKIHRAGQLPFGFHTDHRGAFVDVDGDQILELCMQEPEQREGCWLSSKNTKHRQQYLEQLCKHLDAHDIQKRVGKLSSASQQGSFTAREELEYNKIDKCITEGMLAAEKVFHVNGNVVGLPR